MLFSFVLILYAILGMIGFIIVDRFYNNPFVFNSYIAIVLIAGVLIAYEFAFNQI